MLGVDARLTYAFNFGEMIITSVATNGFGYGGLIYPP
jgi:hypothetical protein